MVGLLDAASSMPIHFRHVDDLPARPVYVRPQPLLPDRRVHRVLASVFEPAHTRRLSVEVLRGVIALAGVEKHALKHFGDHVAV